MRHHRVLNLCIAPIAIIALIGCGDDDSIMLDATPDATIDAGIADATDAADATPDTTMDAVPDAVVEPDPICGNGLVEEGEACDLTFGVHYCPAPWGSCYQCSKDCQTKIYDPLAYNCPNEPEEVATYNDWGRPTRLIEFDEDQNLEATYDDEGRVLTERDYNQQSGLNLEYDAEGRLLRASYFGSRNRLDLYSYDDEGVQTRTFDRDGEGPLAPEAPVQTRFNACGQPVWIRGASEEVTITYGDDGRTLVFTRDDPVGGVIEQTVTIDYFPNSNRIERANRDIGSDGIIDAHFSVSAYRDDGRLESRVNYQGLEGSSAETSFERRMYSSTGLLLKIERDEQEIRFTYSAEGTLETQEHWRGGQLARTTTFDAIGNITSSGLAGRERFVFQYDPVTNIPTQRQHFSDGALRSTTDLSCVAAIYERLPPLEKVENCPIPKRGFSDSFFPTVQRLNGTTEIY